MQKSDIVTLLSFVYLLAAVVFLLFFWRPPGAAAGTERGGIPDQGDVILVPPAETEALAPDSERPGTDIPGAGGQPIETETVISQPASGSMEGALFIGDLRTVGLQEYAGIDGADFFANAGMSVYNIHKKPVSVPSVGRVTLAELLDYKKYGKIYIMLGINEVGCPWTAPWPNTVFDDETASLSAGGSEDDTHFYAKYCAEWGRWIASQTASLPEEGRS